MSFMRIVTFIISVFIVGMVEMMVAGIMNLMSHDLHVSEAWIGQLVTLYAVTFAVCGPILVKITNRFNAKSVLLWTIVVFVLGNAMIVVSPNFATLIIGRIISSAAAALIIVKVLALTAMLTAPEHRGKMIGIVYSGFSGANVLGVPIGTILGGWLGWRATFVFIIVISVLAAGLIAINLAYQNLDRSFVREYGTIECKLSLGASPKLASKSAVQESIKLAIVPTIDSVKTYGLVSIPGMMSGLIISGVDPLQAIKFQLLVVFIHTTATIMSALIATYLSYKQFFNNRDQLIGSMIR